MKTNLFVYFSILIILPFFLFFMVAYLLKTNQPTTDFLLSLLISHFIAKNYAQEYYVRTKKDNEKEN